MRLRTHKKPFIFQAGSCKLLEGIGHQWCFLQSILSQSEAVPTRLSFKLFDLGKYVKVKPVYFIQGIYRYPLDIGLYRNKVSSFHNDRKLLALCEDKDGGSYCALLFSMMRIAVVLKEHLKGFRPSTQQTSPLPLFYSIDKLLQSQQSYHEEGIYLLAINFRQKNQCIIFDHDLSGVTGSK